MMEEINHWQFYHYIVVVLGISLIKLSIAFLLLRFVRVVAYKRFIWVMIGESSSSADPMIVWLSETNRMSG